MPIRTNIPYYFDNEEAENHGASYNAYHIHKIGISKFVESDWSKGDTLFEAIEGIEKNDLLSDDLWVREGDGNSALGHVLEGEEKMKRAVQNLTGLHSAQFSDILKTSFRRVHKYPNGVYLAKEIEKGGVSKNAPRHTMYPDDWGWDKIIEHFYHAFIKSSYESGNKFIGEYKMPGDDLSVKIEIALDKDFRPISFWPVGEE
ncbi:EndoU domain-containing protein [Peribacillus frigoritolerans]|uniref:EndoU domain-containing protein n=1 Tax=Peribacillus frigoritolerans TaxID=450367 RepID=UPI00343CA2D2